MRIDAHHHFWYYTPAEYDWIDDAMASIRRDFLPADLAPEIAAANIDVVISVQARQTLAETEALLAWANNHPWIAGVVGWLPLIDPAIGDLLDRFAANPGLKGVRHVLQAEPDAYMDRADFNAGPVASAIVSRILLANGGHIEGELVDVRVPAWETRTANRPSIALALSEVHRILGMTENKEGITAPFVESTLTGLGCTLISPQASSEERMVWNTLLPSWRLDLEREIDLIEEVARVYGYNRFANTLPAFGGGVRALPWAEAESAVRSTWLAAGFHESIAGTFCSAADAALTAPIPAQVVPLGNPLSGEAGVLRPSLVPGILAAVAGRTLVRPRDGGLFGRVFAGARRRFGHDCTGLRPFP